MSLIIIWLVIAIVNLYVYTEKEDFDYLDSEYGHIFNQNFLQSLYVVLLIAYAPYTFLTAFVPDSISYILTQVEIRKIKKIIKKLKK